MADSGAVELDGATEVVRSAGPSELAAVVRELTENHEHLRRFPVLYYFESGDAEESLSASVRGGAMLLVALRSASPDEVGHAAVYAVVFERILGRLLDDLECDFLGGRHTGADRGDDRSERDAARLDAICGVLVARGCLDAGLGALLVRVESVLEGLAEEHGHAARPLFSDADDATTAPADRRLRGRAGIEVAAAEALQVHRHPFVAGGLHRVDDLLAAVDRHAVGRRARTPGGRRRRSGGPGPGGSRGGGGRLRPGRPGRGRRG